jgi:hypothetical protein
MPEPKIDDYVHFRAFGAERQGTVKAVRGQAVGAREYLLAWDAPAGEKRRWVPGMNVFRSFKATDHPGPRRNGPFYCRVEGHEHETEYQRHLCTKQEIELDMAEEGRKA